MAVTTDNNNGVFPNRMLVQIKTKDEEKSSFYSFAALILHQRCKKWNLYGLWISNTGKIAYVSGERSVNITALPFFHSVIQDIPLVFYTKRNKYLLKLESVWSMGLCVFVCKSSEQISDVYRVQGKSAY